MKKIFTKEIITTSILTFGVVMVALAVNEKFVKPRINGGNTTASAPASAPAAPASTEA